MLIKRIVRGMLIILSFMMLGTIVGIGSVSAKPDLSPENEEMFSQNNIFGYGIPDFLKAYTLLNDNR